MDEFEKQDYIKADDINLFNSIIKRFEGLQENDILSAYNLTKDSLQAYNRWSKVKHDIKKDLRRGEQPHLKDRLEEMCKYIKEVSITSRMVWKYAKEDFKGNKEEM